jgi:Zn-dependent M28 family amino/carboxypeptidase
VQADSIIRYLASDKLKGRVNFSKEQLDAARFISHEFSKYRLKTFPGYKSFYTPFLAWQKLPLSDSEFIAIDKRLKDSVLLYNMVGILPGHSKPGESIIFSAHYDHVGRNRFGENGEIFNGANDNASGTTAVLMLARYFAMRNDNERTLIFCLFAGEELGLLGSAAFVHLIEPQSVKVVINIEMIGKTNRTGRKGFFITGSQHSDLEKILKKNLKNEKVKIRYEGDDWLHLYERSDNYSFAQKRIPAHSIMCSDDDDNCYHRPCDDAEGIDISNMVLIIKAIAKSCTTLINGKDTPVLLR